MNRSKNNHTLRIFIHPFSPPNETLPGNFFNSILESSKTVSVLLIKIEK